MDFAPVRPLVLVVDDEPAIRDVVSEYLFDEGYRVHCAADGQEALDDVAAEPPDVILSDIRMPTIGGLAMIQRLRADGHTMPVVLISTWSPPVGMPGVRYVAKPFDLEHITAAVALSLAGG